MAIGQTGTVLAVTAGCAPIERLDAMGIRPGVAITKIGSMLMRGPVVARVGQSQIALGFGAAAQVLVQLGCGSIGGDGRDR